MRREFEWTGEYQDLEITEWWCETYQAWVQCNVPCPSGAEHTVSRTRIVIAKVMHVK